MQIGQTRRTQGPTWARGNVFTSQLNRIQLHTQDLSLFLGRPFPVVLKRITRSTTSIKSFCFLLFTDNQWITYRRPLGRSVISGIQDGATTGVKRIPDHGCTMAHFRSQYHLVYYTHSIVGRLEPQGIMIMGSLTSPNRWEWAGL